MKRIVEFSTKYNVKVILAYYPPYHRKYNPIERVWGMLEKHWNGSILDSVETTFKYMENMTWKQKNPIVNIIKKTYETGKKVRKDIMNKYENAIKRSSGIEKWFVTIAPENCQIFL